jgi:3-oxoacyl-[acyl-carrier protein] reductase
MFSKNRAEADRVAGDINGLALQGDVAQDADCRRVAKAVLDKWGRIDALVNSAGTTKFVAHADLDGLSADDILGVFRVNVVGPYQMIRACAGALKEARGCVVNISSVASLLGTGSSIAYAASKAALDTMTFSLARALGPEVRLNIVAPGYVRTPWQVAAHGADGATDLERRFAERAPLKAAAEPQDVADAIAWLIERARRVTGEIIYVDGGMHIASPRA